MTDAEIRAEVNRIRAQFPEASESDLNALDGMIVQAAYETLFLRELNKVAAKSGIVKVHPHDPRRQQMLPVGNAIVKHSAALTNILDKLMKHLGAKVEEEDDELMEFE